MSPSLNRLRNLIRAQGLDAYLVPSEDPHLSEYTPLGLRRRQFISGFTGSAGTALVAAEGPSLLFTDGRYWLQAQQELDDTAWRLMRGKQAGEPSLLEYMGSSDCRASNVGVDPATVSLHTFREMEKALAKHGGQLATPSENLVDAVWDDQPPLPRQRIWQHSTAYAGPDVTDKLNQVCERMADDDNGRRTPADALVLTALDEVAWLLNLRGSDVPFNPVFLAYAVVLRSPQPHIALGIDPQQIDAAPEAKQYLLSAGVTIFPYDSFPDKLQEYIPGLRVMVDPLTTNAAVLRVIQGLASSGTVLVEHASPVAALKAIKNPTELAGMRDAHLRDGQVLVAFLAWLEHHVRQGERITEYDAAQELYRRRQSAHRFVSLSFDTISSYGPNAAMAHYDPDPASAAVIGTDLPYLVDSGSQYHDGTTDVTRTVHLGSPTPYQQECFTAVLQGHIALDTAVFPDSMTGGRIDTLTRAPLWRRGLDFLHGTGHGVGAFLNVHEGPQGIGTRSARAQGTKLAAGMTVTNEPGYYEDGNFGIRIENVMVVRRASTPHRFNGKTFLSFEHITWAPIQTSLILPDMLTQDERQWVNTYNASCVEKLAPLLADDPIALSFLKRQVTPI
eukprot:gb/GECH01014863.1/.p1 GENE.gb/GECH01014863.1/~~gb/GECH01014863.1/.p1  ORF type:complete len:617 (+),score=120.10 gb/GECH01014863.1/:1-1851(+)